MAGNPNPVGRKADKILRDALLAVQRQAPERLKRVAEAWWDAAETDQQARNALADRLDGKAPQPIVGDDDYAPVQHEHKVLTAEQSEDLFIAAALKGLVESKPEKIEPNTQNP